MLDNLKQSQYSLSYPYLWSSFCRALEMQDLQQISQAHSRSPFSCVFQASVTDLPFQLSSYH